MLQFATAESSRFTTYEQVKAAIEGGCGWVRLTGSQTEAGVGEMIPLCRDAEVILVLDDDTALVDRLKIHGLHLTRWTRGEIIAAREQLGPHAIIGVTCTDAALAADLKGLDIDYMTVPAPADGNPLDFYREFVSSVRAHLPEIHIVAAGNFPVAMLPSLTATGIAGVELSDEVLEADDPAGFLRLAIASLRR